MPVSVLSMSKPPDSSGLVVLGAANHPRVEIR